MSNIDKQRISAVGTLSDMGYVYRDERIAPVGLTTPATAEWLRADQLEGDPENSEEARELASQRSMIAEALEPTSASAGPTVAQFQIVQRDLSLNEARR